MGNGPGNINSEKYACKKCGKRFRLKYNYRTHKNQCIERRFK